MQETKEEIRRGVIHPKSDYDMSTSPEIFESSGPAISFVSPDTRNTMFDLLGKILLDRAQYCEALHLMALLEPFVERLKYMAQHEDSQEPRK